MVAGGGVNVVHTATVTNTGPSAVTGASFCDVPTLDLTDITIVDNPPLVSDGAIGELGSCTGGWLWDSLDLGVGESATLTLTLTVGPGGIAQTITNAIDFVSSTGGETETGPEPNSASAETVVTRGSDLNIAKTDAPDPVIAGTALT